MSAATPKLALGAPTFIPLGPVKEVSHLNALSGTDTDGDKDVSGSESEEYTKRKQKKEEVKESRKSDQDQNARRGSITDKQKDGGSRRSSVIETYSERNDSGLDTKPKPKLGRRHSMLDTIKNDLRQIVSIPALRKYRPMSNGEVLEDEDIFSRPNDFFRQRKFSLMPRTRRSSSVCSDDSDSVIVTDYEMRKIKMLQALDAMGVQRPKKNTYNRTSDEINILESMALGNKRQSLNTRLIEGTKITRLSRLRYRRKSSITSNKSRTPSLNPMSRRGSRRGSMRTPSTDRSGQPTPDYLSDHDNSNEQRDIMQKIVGIMRPSGSDEARPFHGIRKRASISGTDLASQSIGIFRQKLMRKKGKLRNKFAKLARFLVILLRAWKIHSKSVNKILGNFDSIDAVTKYEGMEVMFDVSDFKASKESQISKKLRELLEKPPKERTEEDVHYIQVALRNYKSIIEYPVHMQKLISEKCWIETYNGKRVIVREGRIPMCFYFILSGSAVVTAVDPDTNRTKTVMFLKRGESFGEQAIMTRSLRQTTVITREKIELLVMSDTDFIDIFMSGGLRDPNDPFLRSINFLEGWPIELLATNPRHAIFSFFKRGTVLVNDSNNSEWIFVVKSGSCSLLKKLKDVSFNKPRPRPKKKKDWKEELEQMATMGGNLSHGEQIQLLHHEEIRRLEEENLTLRHYALPEINIATNAVYSDLRKMHADFVNQNSLTRALDALQNLDDMSMTGSVLTEVIGENTHRRMSLVDLGELVAKGPFLAKGDMLNHQMSASTERHQPTDTNTNEDKTTGYGGKKHVTIRSPYASTTATVKSAVRPSEKGSRFVNVRTLTKGQHFGLEDIIFKEQGSFILVSNGVEVIMINKKLYLDNLDQNRRIQLNDKVYPYPSDEDLQQNFEDYMYWEFHKKQTFENALRHKKIIKIKPHDSRAILEVPPAI